MNITKSMDYRGFVISWQEPAMTSAKWTANVTSERFSADRTVCGTALREKMHASH